MPPVNLGVSFKSSQQFAAECFANLNGNVGIWGVLKLGEKFAIGANIQRNIEPLHPMFPSSVANPVSDLVMSYRSKGLESVGIGVDYFDVTLKLLNMAQKLEVSYFQHMKMPSNTTGKVHNVSLGGIFEHNQNDPLNTLTAGGCWQISETMLVKAKVSTAGNASFLFGFKAGKYPILITSVGVDVNPWTKQVLYGFNLLLQD